MEWLVMAFVGALGGLGEAPDFTPGSMRASALPMHERDIVVVKSCNIPHWFPGYLHFAHHSWIDIKQGAEDKWVRIEIAEVENGGVVYGIGSREARADRRWENRKVNVLGILQGEAARKARMEITKRALLRGPDYKSCYKALPGPNSNTFIREVSRDTGISFLFHHNAIGKDYFKGVSLEWAPSRTGWSLICPFGGCTVALWEGAQFHLFGFTIGRHGFPPRAQVPLLP